MNPNPYHQGFRSTKKVALTSEAYEYTIKHKPGKQLANADALSRLPLSHYPETVPIPDVHLVMQHLNFTPVTAADIKQWTDKDPTLARVRQFVNYDGLAR